MAKLYPSAPRHFAKIRYTQADAPSVLAYAINDLFADTDCEPSDVLVLCVGTDRSTGDSLGPMVGTKLLNGKPPFRVLGTLDNPVHAANLVQTLAEIRQSQPRWVVAVDASLGNMDSVGLVNVGAGPLQPGAGVNKRLPPVGDIYITGIVNVGGFMEYFVLQNTRLSIVVRMAETISNGLLAAFRDHRIIAEQT